MVGFKEKLITLRKAEGLSQEELGEQLGVSRQTVSKWELGQSYPDFQRLVLLSDHFGLSLDALVKDIDPQPLREISESEQKITMLYDDMQRTKGSFHAIINGLAIFGIVGTLFFLLLPLILRAF